MYKLGASRDYWPEWPDSLTAPFGAYRGADLAQRVKCTLDAAFGS